MSNTFRKDSIGVTAKEVLSLKKEVAEIDRKVFQLDQRAAELKEKAAQSRSILIELISEIQSTHPEKNLPDLFTVNGLLIDITHGVSCPVISEVPELDLLFEPTS